MRYQKYETCVRIKRNSSMSNMIKYGTRFYWEKKIALIVQKNNVKKKNYLKA